MHGYSVSTDRINGRMMHRAVKYLEEDAQLICRAVWVNRVCLNVERSESTNIVGSSKCLFI